MRSCAIVAMLFATAGCRGSAEPVVVPALPESFLFVSGAPGNGQIFRWFADSIVPLTTGPGENLEPSAAAGRIAFTSYRDGNAEIYLASQDGSDQHRVITSASTDHQPALSGDARRLVFVSSRSGAQRLFVSDSSGANVIPMETGSPSNTPETAPVWSPANDRVAFASSRTGVSQVFVVPAQGGAAVQQTWESVGAFDPAWSATGDTIYYVAAATVPELRAVPVATGTPSLLARHVEGYGQPACGAFGCIAVRKPYGRAGDIVAVRDRGRRITVLLERDADDRDPALIR